VLLRSCATVQYWAIALTYEIEASGSRRPGGFVVLVFVLVVVFVCLGIIKKVLRWTRIPRAMSSANTARTIPRLCTTLLWWKSHSHNPRMDGQPLPEYVELVFPVEKGWREGEDDAVSEVVVAVILEQRSDVKF